MIRLSVAELSAVLEGTLLGADEGLGRRMVDGVTWDTRTLRPGNVFFALPGERVDGNDFIGSAAASGAGAVVTAREPEASAKALAGEFTCPIVLVRDETRALADLARYWRGKLHAVAIGVTGSSGKTSTKDLLASVLAQRFKTHATARNRNNELGVPATVLAADSDTEALVVEMGMRGLREIEALCGIARPGIGIVTNIGVSHMELLGTRDNIALAKSELLAALPESGLAVVNADDPRTPQVLEDARIDARKIRCMSFGLSEKADVRATDLRIGEDGCARFVMHMPGSEPFPVGLSMPGRHNVLNALAAGAVGCYLGLDGAQIAAGLAASSASPMRMELVKTASGVLIANDAYNANPDSMRAALDTFAAMSCAGRKVAALGDMGELGDDEIAMHRAVGEHAARCGLDKLVCIGALASAVADGARAGGLDGGAILCFEDVGQAARYLVSHLEAGDLLLLKASRFMGLERIVGEFGE